MSSCLWIPQPLVHCALYCTLMGTHSAFDSTLVGETTSSSTRMGTHCKLNGTFIGAQAWGRTEKSMARPWESTHTHTHTQRQHRFSTHSGKHVRICAPRNRHSPQKGHARGAEWLQVASYHTCTECVHTTHMVHHRPCACAKCAAACCVW